MNKRIIGLVITGLVLIFAVWFGVVISIDQDKGILRKLPPMPDDSSVSFQVPDSLNNVLFIWVNSKYELMVGQKPCDIENLRARVKRFVDNNGEDSTLSDSPQDAMIILKNEVGTSYKMYIQVQNEVAAAYREHRDTFGLKEFGISYSDLVTSLKNENDELKRQALQSKIDKIKSLYPMRISEADVN
jgi:biopolymer transport protein ExbD